jgi:hypothetical protein
MAKSNRPDILEIDRVRLMIPEPVASFGRTLTFMQELVADFSDEEMVRQPEGVPNHAAWTPGHETGSVGPTPMLATSHSPGWS